MKAPLTAVVTNTAPPPNVAMRVLDRSGRDARAVGLGEELTLKIELREVSSKSFFFFIEIQSAAEKLDEFRNIC